MSPLGGLQVIVSPLLPIHPSPGEEARRIVRHGYAEVLEWLGEPVGPKPTDAQHALYGFDPARSSGATGVVFVSAELAERMRGGWLA